MPKQDAIQILEQDHQRVRSLFEQIQKKAGSEGGDSESEELLEQLMDAIQNHTAIEEEIFYPAFQQAVRGKDEERLYFESMEEHHVVDMVMPEVEESAGEGDGKTFAAKVKVLKDIVMHHLEEEENELFPRVRKVMKATQLRELGERIAERKEELEEEYEAAGEEELEGDEEEPEEETEEMEAGGEDIESGGKQRGGQRQRGKRGGVDLNRASADELQAIEGIDNARAKKIVAHREEHGPFRSWDDVAAVQGISKTLLGKLQQGASLGR